MRVTRVIASLLFLCGPLLAKEPPSHPRILGIAYVKIAVSDLDKARDFYSLVLRASAPVSTEPCNWCETLPPGVGIGRTRGIQLAKLGSKDPSDLISEIGLKTDNAEGLRKLLKKNNVRVERLTKCGGELCFAVLDPEQHHLVFLEESRTPDISIGYPGAYSAAGLGPSIIHAGFVVRDRAATDNFYKDILGFRPYWHGGMKDDKDDWVAMQVPDGTDWLEYMLNISPTADHHTLGVMNHIALGVSDIQATDKQLIANGWKPTEEPKLGRDGKWQLNLYDPDDTRIEFMEFKPAQEPCCSPFTGPHPGPK
jgi:catechol 2,3-dioxygenase-like lactoylglutathione lyase family enzyme